MNKHECAPVVRLIADSPREAERLIEEWVCMEGHFQPPVLISASIATNDGTITSLQSKWVWDYEKAASMKITIGIGLAISLNIRLYGISKRIGMKWNPSTDTEVYNTFSRLLAVIPNLSKHISISET